MATSSDEVEIEILVRGGHPDFLDLPWTTPLAEWSHERLVDMAHGPSRHVVRFVRYEHRIYALKETGARAAEHEHRALRRLHDDGLPVVEPVGLVRARGTRDAAALITRYLDFSLPYWYVIGRETPAPREVLIDAAVVLLVRLHLAGVFWGDCSLPNVLLRRDAGAMMAYLVDAETTEQRPAIGDPLREHDLDIARENVVGGLLDLQAAGRVRPDVDALAIADELVARYQELWGELTRTDRFDAGERWRIDSRLRRINELGFDVEELSIRSGAGGSIVDVTPTVVEEGHHARELRRRTGLQVQENQARRLLADIENFRARLEQDEDRPVPESVGAARWLAEVYEPVVRAIPADLGTRLEAPEIFHEMLDHRHAMAERAGREISNPEALADYLATVLPARPEERQLFE
jgi:hypothetical protein